MVSCLLKSIDIFFQALSPSVHFALFFLHVFSCCLLFLSYKLSPPLGNLQSVSQLKQFTSKMPLVFRKGVAGDMNAAEEMLKSFLPEDVKMCDVTFPR